MNEVSDSETTMAYVTRCKECKKLVFAYVDRPESQKDCARAVADCIKEGYIVERMTVSEVREGPWCDCKLKKKDDGQEEMFGDEEESSE